MPCGHDKMELKKTHNTKTKGFHRKLRSGCKIYDILCHFKNLLPALDNVLDSLIQRNFLYLSMKRGLWSGGYEASDLLTASHIYSTVRLL